MTQLTHRAAKVFTCNGAILREQPISSKDPTASPDCSIEIKHRPRNSDLLHYLSLPCLPGVPSDLLKMAETQYKPPGLEAWDVVIVVLYFIVILGVGLYVSSS